MKKIYDDEQPLSLDPKENLRMENQLLELKLKAEFGAHTFLEDDIPADVENEFLRNVLEFESKYARSEEIKIYEILGDSLMRPESELNDIEIELCLNDLYKMLQTKNIAVDFGSSYDSRTKYKFIVEELFEESIFPAGVPGMMMHFIYEEFHPDHKIDIEIKAKKFITAWFEQDTDKLLWELADKIILPWGSSLSKTQVKQKIQTVFSRYSNFSEFTHAISDVKFEISDDAGMACAEGIVSYNALMLELEAIAIQGPFKLYFCLEYGWWDICYFEFPGFDFADEDG